MNRPNGELDHGKGNHEEYKRNRQIQPVRIGMEKLF